MTLPRWTKDAECARQGLHPLEFFDEPSPRAEAACAICPVQLECLGHALARPNTKGYWGGTSENDRNDIRRQQRETAK